MFLTRYSGIKLIQKKQFHTGTSNKLYALKKKVQ